MIDTPRALTLLCALLLCTPAIAQDEPDAEPPVPAPEPTTAAAARPATLDDDFEVPDGLTVTTWASSPQLYNPTAMAVPIGGLLIDNGEGGKPPIAVPDDVVLGPLGFWTVDTKSFLKNRRGEVSLSTAGGKLLDSLEWKRAKKGQAWYRIPDGGGWAAGPTKGGPNL